MMTIQQLNKNFEKSEAQNQENEWECHVLEE